MLKKRIDTYISRRMTQVSLSEKYSNASENTNPSKGISSGVEKGTSSLILQAFTTAALLLPGLLQTPAHAADDDEVDFQYSHYQEGTRNLGPGITNDLNPIEVEGIHGGAKISLTDRVKFAFNFTQDTWGGATPRINRPVDPVYMNDIIASASPKIKATKYKIDNANNIVFAQPYDPNNPPSQPVYAKAVWIHALAAASPETRKQGDFNLRYQWDNAEVSTGGGISIENDYESRFGNIGLRKDFNQKQTTVNLGLSYTNSKSAVKFGTNELTYISSTLFSPQMEIINYDNESGRPANAILHGIRQDWATALGLTQILSKEALIEANVSYTRSTGFMSNPYKSVMIAYVDPKAGPDAAGVREAYVVPITEKRPDERNQWTIGTRYVQHINPLDAALHVGYSFFHDDWGINAHTFDADWGQPLGGGWTITPRVRYYSQEAADFYRQFFVMNRNGINKAGTNFGANRHYDPADYPSNYSSDQRLSAYGALSGGVTVTKQFNKGVSLETGFEYYTHAGRLKMGGSGEGEFADFNYWVANAALTVNLSAIGSGGGADSHSEHSHQHSNAPAGVLFSHMLDQADGFMVGYRYMRNRDAGGMLHGSHAAADAAIVNGGCPVDSSGGCRMTPNEMTMNMHMLDLMYAPTDWLNLMLMPQFVDMEMGLRPLADAPDRLVIGHHGDGGLNHGHTTGGVGDTGMYALFKLFQSPLHHLHLGLGISAPTGDVGVRVRKQSTVDNGFIHYGMQLGSGTWDFKPSLTYTGQTGDWAWGGQLSGTQRLENKNVSGYALGDLFQSTAWGSYNLTHWLSASVRGVYTWQDSIKHRYNRELPRDFNVNNKVCDSIIPSMYDDGSGNIDMAAYTADYQACLVGLKEAKDELISVQNSQQRSTPLDHPGNYGGQYVDLGLGLNVNIPGGALAGHSLSFEWLQPVYTNVNGYQLNRDGALAVNWNVAF